MSKMCQKATPPNKIYYCRRLPKKNCRLSTTQKRVWRQLSECLLGPHPHKEVLLSRFPPQRTFVPRVWIHHHTFDLCPRGGGGALPFRCTRRRRRRRRRRRHRGEVFSSGKASGRTRRRRRRRRRLLLLLTGAASPIMWIIIIVDIVVVAGE